MSQISTIVAIPATITAAFGTDEYILALGELPNATDEQIEAACAASDRLNKRHSEALARHHEALAAEARLQQEAIAAQEAAALERVWAEAERQEKAEEAFVAARYAAAKELDGKREFPVATALRGECKGNPVAPRWAAGILRAFRARITDKSRFYGIVGETLATIDREVAREDEETAEAERIRQEAKRRQEKNRRDRAAEQSRNAKGGKK
ncbi:MAG: hypothetical protein A3D48_04140 [Candidatus Yanofskybacteria bacterium RIFCSPHIGHO2_02_FULL_43_17]|nr:MAG: hypothetical protein A3D48_04140 [Candidatus Yanofskybacteria bacterium RIFCSPHIGHO2_02_FULL_43_17]